MPLSKNLYETGDCAAALLLSLETPNIPLALTILNELNASLESDLVHKVLGFAWLLSQPDKETTPQRWTTFRSRRYDYFLASFALKPLTIPVEPTLETYPRLPTAAVAPPPQWHARPTGWTDHECGTLYAAVQHAIQHKQAWRAYLLARPLRHHPSALLSFLKALGAPDDFLSFAEYPQLHGRLLLHAMYIFAYPPPPTECKELVIYPQGRVFAIQPAARNRWNIPPVPDTKLIGQPNFIFDETPYWTAMRNKYQIDLDARGNIKYESEQLYQEFFEAAFPADIPDEWSAQERAKSHGCASTNYQQEPNPWAPTFAALIVPTMVRVAR